MGSGFLASKPGRRSVFRVSDIPTSDARRIVDYSDKLCKVLCYHPVMSLIHNERTKLAANLLNAAASACFAVGIAAPIVAAFTTMTAVPLVWICLDVVLWAGALVWLHTRAHYILEGLRDE